MKTVLHKAATRGFADHGWLQSWHTFSFAGYYDPQRIHFGALRVLNDDTVAGGNGFGKHPHDNMEIISIPLQGDLEHADNTGTQSVIRHGDVQIMSAGTGIVHSEKNANSDQPVKFLQIWVFPRERQVAPRYDQQSFTDEQRHNQLLTVVSPIDRNDGGVGIHQDAWFHLSKLDKGQTLKYDFKKQGNGLYVFLLRGELTVNEVVLQERDGLGVWETQLATLNASEDAEVLLMEVPMAV